MPGVTLVCPDSQTCTVGGIGALAWGGGSTEAEHALATKTLVVKKPATMRVSFDGQLPYGVTAKDMILHLIGKYTASGGVGYAIEFAGTTITALPIEARLTLCNMAVEFGAWTGVVAPDDKTFEYVKGRPYAPKGEAWDRATEHWKSLVSDSDAGFDREIAIDVANIADFIGSCTNSRLSDLRNAAKVLKDRKVAPGVKAICVPGSSQVKLAAEAEGLDRIFTEAGFEWRESGCSMCFFAGGESFGVEERVVTSTNRNFENRQGPRTRSHLASPTTVAASAVLGKLADVRKLEPQE